MINRIVQLAGLALAQLALATIVGEPVVGADPPTLKYRVIASLPHDAQAFTQGLAYLDGCLYESTGSRGTSTLRQIDAVTGKQLAQHELSDKYFAEGLAACGEQLVQLTWREGVALVYDAPTFKPVGQLTYPGEGWGLCHDGGRFIHSDGSPTLRFFDSETYAQHGSVDVSDKGEPLAGLNELEFVEGSIYANVWKSDRIAVIDPARGEVTAWIDLASLWPAAERSDQFAILNGIAYDAERRRLWVTGKRWPKIFLINVSPANP